MTIALYAARISGYSQSGARLVNEMLTNENVSSLGPGLLKLHCVHKPAEDLVKMLILLRMLNSYKLPGDGPRCASTHRTLSSAVRVPMILKGLNAMAQEEQLRSGPTWLVWGVWR